MWITFRDFSSMRKNAKSGRKNRSVTWRRVTRPDLCGVVAQKSHPPLASWLVGANSSHVLLDGSLADPKAQFEEFTPDPFCSPAPAPFRPFSVHPNGFGRSLDAPE